MKKKLVVLTGAGISAESGISTFRDANGLWENHRIEDVATPEAWDANPEIVLEFYNTRHENAKLAQPNKAHQLLAELEKDYEVQIITQNVDNLHERAGSTRVLHLHGSLFQKCSDRDRTIVESWDEEKLTYGEKAPDGGYWRPDIVWFGEDVPNIVPAMAIVAEADILVVIGTSLQVYPAAGLIHDAQPYCEKYLIDPNMDERDVPRSFTYIKDIASTGMNTLVEKYLK